MEKASRLFITADFKTFKKWFLLMFEGHTCSMKPGDPQIAMFTDTFWALREEKPMYCEFSYLDFDCGRWYTSYGKFWSGKEDFFKFFDDSSIVCLDDLNVVYFDDKLDKDVKNCLFEKIKQKNGKISVYNYSDKGVTYNFW